MTDRLKIPPEGLAAMQALVDWSDEVFAQVVREIEAAQPKIFPEKWIPRVVGSQLSLAESELAPFATMVRSLLMTWRSTELPLSDFVEVVLESVEGQGKKDKALVGKRLALLKSRLREVFDIKSMQVSARASEIYSEVDRPFKKAAMTTEIRPVFHGEPVDTRCCFLMTQTLQIEFVDNGEIQTAYYCLDALDIDKMIAVLQTAKQESGATMASLAAAGLTLVSIPTE